MKFRDTRQNGIRRRHLLGAAALPTIASWPALAQDAPKPPPVQDFFRNAELTSVSLSPDGRKLVGLRNFKGRKNVVVVDLSARKATTITAFTDADVAGPFWISDQRILFGMHDSTRGGGEQIPSGLFGINADASAYLELVERSFLTEGGSLMPVGTDFHSRIYENGKYSTDIYVQLGSRQAVGKASSNIYRLDTLTRRKTLVTLGGPNLANHWVLDTQGVPRAALSKNGTEISLHYRDKGSSDWRRLLSYRENDSLAEVYPLEIDATGTLYVAAHAGQDTMGLYTLDTATGKLSAEPVAAIKGFDLAGGLLFNAERSRLLGVRYEAAQTGTVWLDERLAKIQAEVDATLPGQVNLLQPRASGDRLAVMVTSYSDRDPGHYYVRDEASGKLTGVGASRPWIHPEAMRPTTFYRYKARDGMEIPAQLTLPAGIGSKVPLVVLHYGGPWVRAISWHWDPIVQFLASRGYAVFMPAPRASTGFGSKLYEGGKKQWGLAMQDDVTDGVQELIARGVVDPQRVAIAGASYGGYLTMMGLVKEPKLYRCGINWVGVTDPEFMFSVTWTDFNRFGGSEPSLKELIGDPDKDAEQFARTSPLKRASEIHQPVLMAYGGLDTRVPLINGTRMRDALSKHNPNVEWIVYPDEWHGWQLEANNYDFWSRVERFLAKNLA